MTSMTGMTKRSDNSLLIFDVVIVAVSVAAILLTGARYGRAIESYNFV